ncbi:MAG TPA: hypothetical protein VF974_02105 [Patescibacteria group bacterium]
MALPNTPLIENRSSNKNIIWFVLLTIVIIALICVALLWFRSDKLKKSNQIGDGYSVVYLTSGEIYVGHLYTYPKLTLKGAYILQNVKTSKDKSDLQLFPLSDAVWSPTDLYLNPEHVIYYGPLSENSVAAKAIKSKGK